MAHSRVWLDWVAHGKDLYVQVLIGCLVDVQFENRFCGEGLGSASKRDARCKRASNRRAQIGKFDF